MSGGVHNAADRAPFDVVVIAASLGGPAALATVLAGLPADFPAGVLVVQHRRPVIDESLPRTLQRRSRLTVRLAQHGQTASEPGVRVLPARSSGAVDFSGRLVLGEFHPRPADELIASAGAVYRQRALAVVLTGAQDDGARGVRTLKRHGGRALAEDPVTAVAGSMPAAALATGCVDLVLPLHRMSQALIALTMAPGAADLLRVPIPPWAGFAA